jgi:hypothetical protein
MTGQDSIPFRFVVVVQLIHVQFQGAIVASQSSEKYCSDLKEVWSTMHQFQVSCAYAELRTISR